MTKYTSYLLNLIIAAVLPVYLSAQETTVDVFPLSGSYIFYYDGAFYDFCSGSNVTRENTDSFHQIPIGGIDILVDTIELSNDHYGQNCYVYDVCIVDTVFFVNIYVPKARYGSYSFKMTAVEQQLIRYAASQVVQYDTCAFIPVHHSLNPSEDKACYDCEAVSYIHIKKQTESMDYIIHHLADGIPDALVFLRDAIGAIVDNHCRNDYISPLPISDFSLRKRLIVHAKKYNCPLGLVSDGFILQE